MIKLTIARQIHFINPNHIVHVNIAENSILIEYTNGNYLSFDKEHCTETDDFLKIMDGLTIRVVSSLDPLNSGIARIQ